MHLDIKVEHETNYHVIALTGRLDNLSAGEFAAAVNAEIDSGARQVLIDGFGLEYVSSAGIAELLAAGKRLQASGGNLVFAALTKPVRSVFEIVGFPKLFKIHETRDSALAGAET
jgi:anti-anti-sigma factor